MYCDNCNSRIPDSSKFCPECGARVSASMRSPALESGHGRSGQGGPRFNLSKPLCLIMALVLLATFFPPWLKANAKLNDMKLLADTGVGIFGLHSFVRLCADTALKLTGSGADLTAEGESMMWRLNGLLLLIEGVFFIIALHFLLFGVIGLFSGGKARYWFARVGSTAYLICLVLFIVLVSLGNAVFGSIASGLASDGLPGPELSIKPAVTVYIAAVLALLFRVFGIRYLRLLNGKSCIKKGDEETARRELTLIDRRDLLHPNGHGLGMDASAQNNRQTDSAHGRGECE